MGQITTKTQFLELKKQQQISLWSQSKISTAQLVDWILAYGTDADVEWLSNTFDPQETM